MEEISFGRAGQQVIGVAATMPASVKLALPRHQLADRAAAMMALYASAIEAWEVEAEVGNVTNSMRLRPWLRTSVRGERLDHAANLLAYPFVPDLVVCADKLKRLALSVDISLIITRLGPGRARLALSRGNLRGHLLEEM